MLTILRKWLCAQDFMQKSAAEHQERVAASAKPATTCLALVPPRAHRRFSYCRHPAGARGRAGDMEGVAVWKMILNAIKELLDKTPPGDQSAVH